MNAETTDLSQSKVLIVDDTESNIDLLVAAIGDEYDIYVAMDGKTAIEVVRKEPPDIILLDVMMPGMDGFDVCRELKGEASTRDIPVIFLTALSDIANKEAGFKLGAVDYIQKPFEILEVKARLNTHLMLGKTTAELQRYNKSLETLVGERTKELELTQTATIESLASLAEYRDTETGWHIRRTQHYIRALAVKIREHDRFMDSLDDGSIDMLVRSAPLHDIGKVGVPDHILLKKGKHSPEETEIMKQHTVIGQRAIKVAEASLGRNSFLRFASDVTISHHERWDGSGYPYGLKGDEIPLPGRLMALADVYDALISRRVYKDAIAHEDAVKIIMQGDGRTMPGHFDPDMLSAFFEIQEEFRMIATKYADRAGDGDAVVEHVRGLESAGEA